MGRKASSQGFRFPDSKVFHTLLRVMIQKKRPEALNFCIMAQVVENWNQLVLGMSNYFLSKGERSPICESFSLFKRGEILRRSDLCSDFTFG